MNATILYTQLSRQVFMLKADASEESLSIFLDPEKGLYKLRTYLSCRSCRKLGKEHYGAEYCNHILCKSCFNENKNSNGCKWCRNEGSLVIDYKHQILLGLYNNLCAILLNYVTGWDGGSGISNTKQRLIQFLNEDCLLPEKENSKNEKATKISDSSILQNNNNFIFEKKSFKKNRDVMKKDANIQIDISSSCYTCHKCQTTRKKTYADFSHDPKPLSDCENEKFNEKLPSPYNDCRTIERKEINEVFQSKSKSQPNGKEGFIVSKGNSFKKNTDPVIKSKKKQTISSRILSKRNSMNIFEKFGLALTPPQIADEYISTGKRVYQKKRKEKSDLQVIEPKLEPLKLKMKRVNTDSDDSSYNVQYNITNGFNKKGFSNFHLDDIQSENFNSESCRKNKRRASTFITNYAIFSDDSDFEQMQDFQKCKKPWIPKEIREVCGCGVGTNIKYLNDICKRSRCPCYSQGRACLNCKCRFCSNPFVLENDKVSIEHGSSSSECQINNQKNIEETFIEKWTKEDPDLVDVESL